MITDDDIQAQGHKNDEASNRIGHFNLSMDLHMAKDDTTRFPSRTGRPSTISTK